jgi:hypothetical protein
VLAAGSLDRGVAYIETMKNAHKAAVAAADDASKANTAVSYKNTLVGLSPFRAFKGPVFLSGSQGSFPAHVDPVVAPGQWTHLAFSCRPRQGLIMLFINGQYAGAVNTPRDGGLVLQSSPSSATLAAAAAATAAAAASAAGVTSSSSSAAATNSSFTGGSGFSPSFQSIGTSEYGPVSFAGDIHEVRMFRMARSQGEIVRDMHATLTRNHRVLLGPSLLFHLPMTEASGAGGSGKLVTDTTMRLNKCLIKNGSWIRATEAHVHTDASFSSSHLDVSGIPSASVSFTQPHPASVSSATSLFDFAARELLDKSNSKDGEDGNATDDEATATTPGVFVLPKTPMPVTSFHSSSSATASVSASSSLE